MTSRLSVLIRRGDAIFWWLCRKLQDPRVMTTLTVLLDQNLFEREEDEPTPPPPPKPKETQPPPPKEEDLPENKRLVNNHPFLGGDFSKGFLFSNSHILHVSLQALKEKELGNTAYKNKDFGTALKHYEEAIKQDPTNMSYISNKAGTHR